ncbi:MAG: diguanylate cyclase [Deltaproteobacteria bacterium]|nr:diguanylate cyclase [Deltaproteobacteria bacterium]
MRKGVWRSFTLNITVVILVFVMGVFIGIFVRSKQLIDREILTRARAHFHAILLTRRWNADYGGVFVEKKAGVESNPYLENPDIKGADGRAYTKKNAALMTREISELAKKEDLVTYHITSLRPINPHNLADEFETQALRSFEQDKKESFSKVIQDGKYCFRYMAPLMIEKSCLTCHGKQGYKDGDVRGGISVTFNVDEIERSLTESQNIIIGLAVVTAAALLGIVYFFIFGLMKRLNEAKRKIEEMAVTDELTSLYNRRFFFTKLSEEAERAKRQNYNVGCIMGDIDHFKKVNDTYGHHTGDVVLQRVAQVVKDCCRTYDVAARYGGEELIVLLPKADEDISLTVAERIRSAVEDCRIDTEDGRRVSPTISLGVSCFTSDQLSLSEDSSLITKSADEALYRAKANGRNRVEVSWL